MTPTPRTTPPTAPVTPAGTPAGTPAPVGRMAAAWIAYRAAHPGGYVHTPRGCGCGRCGR